MQFNPPRSRPSRGRSRGAAPARERTQQWPAVVSTAEVPVFGDPAHEYEKFSPDTAWMPTAVLIAKSTYVWLAQLSKQYGRAHRAAGRDSRRGAGDAGRRGINSLWLIGVWERSRASKTIKQLCGNHDAVASAYSLFDYAIADDLGGEAAYINLRDRAYRHGIRLASDMVPNHMGIDSPWVVEHPEWFISRAGLALSGLQLQRARSLARRARRDQDRGPLLRAVRRRRGLSPPRPPERRDALHLPRQRRHQLSLERHRAARLPESGGARAGDPDHSARGAAVSGDSLRRRHDAGQAALSPAVVSRARAPAAPFPRAPSTA